MGFIGLDRGIVDHWIYQDAEYFKVWFEMLYRARYSPEPEKKLFDNILVDMHYGEFVYGRNKWSERLKITERRLRTLISKLVNDEMIEVVNNYPRFTVYRIINYAKYNQQNDQQEDQAGQGKSGHDDQQNDQPTTSRRPAGDQQATTKEQGSNKGNKENKDNKGIKEHIPYEDIITYLNSVLGSSFKHSTKATQNHIKARFAEKFTLEDFKTVIDKKCKEWMNDPKMSQYLRPETLFGTKFESYLNQFTVIKGNSAVDKLKQMHMNAKAKEEEKREGIGSY